MDRLCDHCKGTGILYNRICPVCYGGGKLDEIKKALVKINDRCAHCGEVDCKCSREEK